MRARRGPLEVPGTCGGRHPGGRPTTWGSSIRRGLLRPRSRRPTTRSGVYVCAGDRVNRAAGGPVGPPGRTRRRSRRAGRGLVGPEADAYQAEHGGFLGDVAGSSGARRGSTRPRRACSGRSPGRRVLEVGAGAAQCARWLVGRAPAPSPSTCPPASWRRRRWRTRGPALRVPAVQADAAALPFGAGSFDLAAPAYGALPFVADPGPCTARWPGCCGRAAAGCSRCRTRSAGPSRTSRAGGADRHVRLLRPAPVRGDRRRGDRSSYVEHHRTLGDHVRRWSPPGSSCWTSSSRSGRPDATGSGAAGRRCAAGCCRARRSSSPTGPDRRSGQPPPLTCASHPRAAAGVRSRTTTGPCAARTAGHPRRDLRPTRSVLCPGPADRVLGVEPVGEPLAVAVPQAPGRTSPWRTSDAGPVPSPPGGCSPSRRTCRSGPRADRARRGTRRSRPPSPSRRWPRPRPPRRSGGAASRYRGRARPPRRGAGPERQPAAGPASSCRRR